MSRETKVTCDQCRADITEKTNDASARIESESFDFCDIVCLAGWLEENSSWARKTHERRKQDEAEAPIA